MLRLCSCGFATDDDDWFDGHLFERPAHEERTLERYVAPIAQRQAMP